MPPFRHPGFLTPDECVLIRHDMDVGTVEEAEVLLGGVQRRIQVRNASLIEPSDPVISLVETRLESCRELVAASQQLVLGRREGPGFIRYPDGGYYKVHRDRGSDPQWPDAARRAVSIVIFLNSSGRARGGEFDGGVLRLFLPDRDEDVVPKAGLLVAFPADVPHEVTTVSSGARDTIVDWFYFGALATDRSTRTSTPTPDAI